VGPRDFKTESEMTPRPRGEAPAAAPSPPAADVRSPTSVRPSERGTILWYRLYALDDRGRTESAWKPVAGGGAAGQGDGGRQRLLEADEQEIRTILDRFEAVSRTLRGQLTMTRVPSAGGFAVQLSGQTREGRRTLRLEVEGHCFEASYTPPR